MEDVNKFFDRVYTFKLGVWTIKSPKVKFEII